MFLKDIMIIVETNNMKNLILSIGGLLIGTSVNFGQTNVIALKSHSGSSNEILHQKDNFGLPDYTYMYRNIDSVKYNSAKKIVVQYRTNIKESDTLNYINESDEAIQNHLKAIRMNPWYSEKTQFIDFPEEIEKMANDRRNTILDNKITDWVGCLLIIGLLSAMYHKRKKLSKVR